MYALSSNSIKLEYYIKLIFFLSEEKVMIVNIGRFDQILRIGISLGLVYVGLIDKDFIQDPLSSYIIGAIGIVSTVIALIRFCPLYVIAHINTCPHKNSRDSSD